MSNIPDRISWGKRIKIVLVNMKQEGTIISRRLTLKRIKSVTLFGMWSVAAAAVLVAVSISFASDGSQTWEERNKEEPYLILRSEKTVELREDFTVLTTTHTVAKILKDSGKKLGEISITYDKSREEVKDIQAFITIPSGEKLKHKEIQDLNAKQEYAIYSDERTKMVTMPNVVVGSIIDWQATVESKKPVIEKNFYDMVYLSSNEPVKVQKYTLIAPKNIVLHIKSINSDRKPIISYSVDKIIYTWEITNNEKIEQEEYMPAWDEIYEAVVISTVDSWESISKWGLDLFRKNLRLSDVMKEKVQEITSGKKSQADKIQAIIEYIQEDFRYVYMGMDFHGYEPHRADQIFLNKYGDCKDHTLLGMAMLSEIGVKAYPVMFSAMRSFNSKNFLPMPAYFNHAILFFELDGKQFYSDLLRKGYYFYEIPEGISNKKVFVLNGNGGVSTSIPKMDEAETTIIYEENVAIQEDGDTIVEVTVHFSRSFSILTREAYKNAPADEREKFSSALESSMSSGGKVLQREWKNLDTPHANITVRLKYENSHLIQHIGNMMMFGYLQRQRETLFTAPKRKYPIVFAADSRIEKRSTFSIPAGYEIVNVPKEIQLIRDFAQYERLYRIEGNNISGKETFAFKESKIPATDYQKVMSFYDDITRLTNDMIMIKKKG